MRTPELYEKMAELSAQGVYFAVITVIGVKGSSPRGLGAKMVVLEDGTRLGTIGGDCLENDAVEAALRMLGEEKSKDPREQSRAEATVAVRSLLLEEEEAGGVGMLCGGKVDVLIEVVKPQLNVVVLGSGPVATGIVELAHFLDVGSVLVDPIPPKVQLPASCKYINARHEEGIKDVPVGDRTAVVIVTRHKNDVPSLKAALKTRAGYIGMIGSRHRVQTIFNRLAKDLGVGLESFAPRVYAPIGLDIGANSPQELAVSIMAEILAHFRKGSGRAMALYAELGAHVSGEAKARDPASAYPQQGA